MDGKMKKIMAAVAVLSALILASCGTSQNSNGWYSDFNAAKKAAQAKNKEILFFVNSDSDVPGSENGVRAVLSKEFVDSVKSDFVCVHFDFTDLQSVFGVAENSEISSREQKNLEKRRALLNSQFKVADFYGIRETPVLNILSKEGYFISEINCEFNSDSIEGFSSLLKLEADEISNFNKKVAATKKGSKTEKIDAIDVLFEEAADVHKLALYDLLEKAVSMDSKNSSGKIGKYLFQIAHTDAYDKLLEQDFAGALKIYEKCAENKYMTPEYAQSLYFMCAELASKIPNVDSEDVISYMRQSVQAAPESELVPQIQQYIEFMENSIAAEKNSALEETSEKSPE